MFEQKGVDGPRSRVIQALQRIWGEMTSTNLATSSEDFWNLNLEPSDSKGLALAPPKGKSQDLSGPSASVLAPWVAFWSFR